MGSRLAIITFVDGGDAPDNSLPGSGNRPDNSLPGSGNRPDNSLPGYPGRPDNSLPGYPGYPVQLPVYPFDPAVDNTLPTPPSSTKPIFFPGAKFVLRWMACKGFVLVPDNSLPTTPGKPDQGLPPTAQPK